MLYDPLGKIVDWKKVFTIEPNELKTLSVMVSDSQFRNELLLNY